MVMEGGAPDQVHIDICAPRMGNAGDLAIPREQRRWIPASAGMTG